MRRLKAADLRSAIITYEGVPLAHGGAHSLRAQDLVQAWEKVESFVQSCTRLRTARKLAWSLPSDPLSPRSAWWALAAKLTLRHGPPTAPLRWSGDHPGALYRWGITSKHTSLYVDRLRRRLCSPTESRLPLRLDVRYELLLTHRLTGEVLPYQEPEYYLRQCVDFRTGQRLGRSTMLLRLGARSTLFAYLSIPFDAADKQFAEYVEFLRNRFPAKMSSSNFRIWTLAKDRQSYYSRRLPQEAFARGD